MIQLKKIYSFLHKNTDEISFHEAVTLFAASIKQVWLVDKKYVIFTCFVLVLRTIPALLGAFVGAIFNQRIILGAEKFASYLYAYYPLLIAFAVSILNGFFFVIWRWAETKSMDKITAFLLRESVRKASTLDYASYDDPEFYNQIQNGWAQDGEMFINSATTVFGSISYVIGMTAYISVLAYIDWKLMLAVTVLRICLEPLSNKHYTWTYRLNNELAELRRKEQYYRGLFRSKEMVSEGRLFDLFNYAKSNYLEAHKKIYRETFIHNIKLNAVNLFTNVVYSFPLVAGYVYLSVCVYNGSVSLANMTLFVSMYAGFVNQIYNTINELSGFRYYAEQSRYAREFLELPTNIFKDDDSFKDNIPQSNGHSIEFSNVTFRYPGTEKNVLEDVSFKVEANECVSIIGANGAGKTTLLHLMMRLYDPTEGIILLDGRDIREYSVESLYAIYGVLFQDYCSYAVSAKESITLSTDEIDDEKISYSLKASTVYKFIDTLECGLNTPLSRSFETNGTELSGGQKQRIALAKPYDIELRNVSFTYENSGFGLKNINMKISEGKKIAIVGENGGGKTTLTKLLLRLYDPDSGSILIDGKPLTKIALRHYRNNVGIAFQEFPLYSLPLRDNLSVYEPANDKEMNTIFKSLSLDKVLEKNNATFDTDLTRNFDENGIMLSGGEKQKLAVARLMTKKFGLLIFDEPTAALDPMAEAELNRMILDKANTSTTILISHRLSNVVNADYIYVVRNGEIEECGTHEALMAEKGFYYKMFELQAENYK